MGVMNPTERDVHRRFREEYAAQRASEGRGLSAVDALTWPYVTEGALVRQWAVRARSSSQSHWEYTSLLLAR